AATVDALRAPTKPAAAGGRLRRVGFYSAIRREVPIRTFNDWKDPPPGFCEIDLVAHGGTSVAGSFGVPRSPGHDHAQLGGHLVEALGHVLADNVQDTAARTGPGFRLDDDLLARQWGRQMAAICAPAFDALAPDDRVLLLCCRVLGTERGLHVLKGKGHFLTADAPGLAAALDA